MNLIIGNGINYEQFPHVKWDDFLSCIKTHFTEMYASLKSDTNKFSNNLHIFISKIITNILTQNNVDAMFKLTDLNFLISKTDINDFLYLFDHLDYEKDSLIELYYNLDSWSKGSEEAFLYINKSAKCKKIMTEISFIYLGTVMQLLFSSIKNVLMKQKDMKGLEYSHELVKWISGFNNIFTLNVDGILNKENIEASFLHGFFSDDLISLKYYDKQLKNVKNQNPEIFEDYKEIVSKFTTSPYEVNFDYTSYAKIQNNSLLDSFFTGEFLKKSLLDYDDKNFTEEHFHDNQDVINIDRKGYKKLLNISGNLIILGVSYNFDQFLFEIISRNKYIKNIYYYGDKGDYLKIKGIMKNKKIEYMGFFEKKHYTFN